MIKVLVLGEDGPTLERINGIFAIQHIKTLVAASNEEAYLLTLERKPDLVIIDSSSQKKEAFVLLDRLRTNVQTLNIPIVIIGAKQSQDAELEALRAGADDFMGKPLHDEKLYLRTRNLIDLRTRLSSSVSLIPENEKVTSKDELFLKQVMDIIERNLDKVEFEIDDFVRELGYSRSSIQKKVRTLTGKTTSNLIRDYRLERAKQLIDQNAGNLTEVAAMVGFNSLSYFSNCYKIYFGTSPMRTKMRA